MPRKREPIRGLWEREPGSDIWWIRYRVDGVLKREKAGAWGAAKDLLNKRKNEIREGIKMPENMRHTSIRFKTLCDDILVFSKKHHRDFRSVEIRVKKIVADFGEKPGRCSRSSFERLFGTARSPATRPGSFGSARRTMDEFAF
jgi:hypothetical protein